MVTTEIFEKLKSLQVILGRKYELESKIANAPQQLSSQDELLAKLKKEFIAKNNDYEDVKDAVNAISLDLDEAIKVREAGEKNMDNITTHREYEALDKQIQEASLKEDTLRKELQKEQKKLSELDDAIKTTQAMITSQENDLNTSKEKLDNEINAYNTELAQLKAEEDQITPNLDQEILFKFQRIIQRNSEGIVAVKNGVCTGCNMILPAQFANEVHEGDSILFCPYCSRILYYEEAEADEQETYFTGLGSLADDDENSDDELYDEDDELLDEEIDEDSLDETDEEQDEDELDDSEDPEDTDD